MGDYPQYPDPASLENELNETFGGKGRSYFRSPMGTGMGSTAGEYIGGEMKGDRGGGFGAGVAVGASRQGSKYFNNMNRNPAGSRPSVRVGIENNDPRFPALPALRDVKSTGIPLDKDVASSPNFGTPDYSEVYAIDDKIRKAEAQGASFADLLGREILGHDAHGERVAGLYRTRQIARQDAESKFATYVKASMDPDAPDPSSYGTPHYDAAGDTWQPYTTYGGSRKMKKIGSVAVGAQTKAKEFSPNEYFPDKEGNAVVGMNPDKTPMYMETKEEVPGEAEEPAPLDVSAPEAPSRSMTTKTSKMKFTPKPISPEAESRIADRKDKASDRAADNARAERDAATKAGERAYESYLRGHPNEEETTREANAEARRVAATEEYKTGKRPKQEEPKKAGKTLVFNGYDKNNKPIYVEKK